MDKSKQPKRGRPTGSTSSNSASERLPMVRVTKEKLEAYKTSSKRENKTFSAWVRDALDDKIKQ